MAISFKGAHFPQEIILMGVRWYVAYPLSTGMSKNSWKNAGWSRPRDHPALGHEIQSPAGRGVPSPQAACLGQLAHG